MKDGALQNRGHVFDVAIIGGGINGAGIALDAALRDLSVVLFDKKDFGSYTTSASTKLIHGGLRYLEYLEFPLVRESLRERERLLKNAPHLVQPLKLHVPIYKHSRRGPLLIKAGMILYDLLSYDKSLPFHSFKLISQNGKVNNSIESSLKQDGLKAITSFFDCQVMFPERLCLEIILSAREAGALVYNYFEVTKFKTLTSGLNELELKDVLNERLFNIKAKVVVNATGPYVDQVCKLVGKNIIRKMGGTKGSHILIDKFEGGPAEALYIESIQDGRPFFIIPWKQYFLVGTTDIYYEGDLDEVIASEEEIEYLLYELNYFIPARHFTKNDVLYTYSGIRPLPYEPGKKESQVTRKHIIFDHEKNEGHKNFISIIGGKLTTYRNLAEECVDLICIKLGLNKKTRTREYPLFGGYGISNFEKYINNLASEYAHIYGLQQETVEYLIRFYGSKFRNVLKFIELDHSLSEKITEHHEDIKAQVIYAAETELAKKLEDILIRRTGIGTSKCLGINCAETVANIIAPLWGWDTKEKNDRVKEYINKIKSYYVPVYKLNKNYSIIEDRHLGN